MFIQPPFKAPSTAEVSFDVRSSTGRKPFKSLKDAQAAAAEVRATPNGWAEIAQVVRLVIEARADAKAPPEPLVWGEQAA